MWRMTFSKSLTPGALFFATAVFCGGAAPAVGQVLDIRLWPDALVVYRYCSDDPLCEAKFDLTGDEAAQTDEKGDLRAMMNKWEKSLTVRDPGDGEPRQYVRFKRCTKVCPDNYVLVRYTNLAEDGNMCSYDRTSGTGEKLGRNPDGQTVLHFRKSPRQTPRIMLHELGHCLGLWHECNRRDADRWLWEVPDQDGDDFAKSFGTRARLMPVVGNYDYDSIMHYSQLAEGPVFGDYFANILDKTVQGPVVSQRDRSRVLQYYANERYPNWGLFKPTGDEPQDPDALPNPYLANGVEAVGTPSIAYQSPGNYDLFARGSDDHIYWKLFRRVGSLPVTTGWRSIGCCFRSDPSAVSRSVDRIDVVAVSGAGNLRRIKYIDGVWSASLTIRGGHPVAGLKQNANGDYVGAAIASRGADLLDVFAVDGDGLLAVTTWSAGNWGEWHTLGARYDVTARPAAVALSATDVRLAINEADVHLYEPLVTFLQRCHRSIWVTQPRPRRFRLHRRSRHEMAKLVGIACSSRTPAAGSRIESPLGRGGTLAGSLREGQGFLPWRQAISPLWPS
jgi:hypothetical protein